MREKQRATMKAREGEQDALSRPRWLLDLFDGLLAAGILQDEEIPEGSDRQLRFGRRIVAQVFERPIEELRAEAERVSAA